MSIAGSRRLKNEAANITPAAKPNMVSNTLIETDLTNRMGMHPKLVARPAKRLAEEPHNI
jgi:hypothetical protein